jgi:hypothetical protein
VSRPQGGHVREAYRVKLALEAIHIRGHIDRKPISRMLINDGAAVNLMLYAMFKKLGREDDELVKTNCHTPKFQILEYE